MDPAKPGFTAHPRTPTERERELEDLLAKDPENESLLKSLAFARYSNQNWSGAFEIYVRLMRSSKDPAVHFYAGNTMFRLQNFRTAIGAWERSIQLDTAGLFKDRALERVSMARAELAKSEPKKPAVEKKT